MKGCLKFLQDKCPVRQPGKIGSCNVEFFTKMDFCRVIQAGFFDLAGGGEGGEIFFDKSWGFVKKFLPVGSLEGKPLSHPPWCRPA